MGCLLGSSVVVLVVTSSRRAYATRCDPEPLPLPQATADLYLCRRHPNTQRQVWLSLCGVSGSWYTQRFVWALRASLAGIGLDSKHGFAPSPALLSCWGFSFVLGRGVFFFGGIQPSLADGGSAVSCNFGALTEDECASFYYAIFTLSLLFSCSVVSDSCVRIDCGQPGSFVYGIFWLRILEWMTISSSRGSSWLGIEPMSPALLLLFTHIYLISKLKGTKEPRYGIIDLVSLCMILKICFVLHYSKFLGSRKWPCWG